MLCNWVGVECLLERERIFILVGLVIFVVLVLRAGEVQDLIFRLDKI